MTGLIVTTYNRPEYLQRCFESLQKVNFPDDVVVFIIDDCSTDSDTIKLINDFTLGNVPIVKHRKTVNLGIRSSMEIGYNLAFKFGCENVINLDGDAIVKPNFINRLLELKAQFPNNIVSGFNSRNEDNGILRNPIISEHKGYALKKYANGINMVINRRQYDTHVGPALKIQGNWDFNSTNNDTPVVVAVPSLVQHIGLNSSMGHSNNPDVAFDFVNHYLPTVTLFGSDCRDKPGILRAAEICKRDIKFGETKIITECLYHGIEEYSKYYIKHLTEHIDTEHVLIIHADGYIQNPDAWDNDWLQYDYIGATWGYKDNMNVGNGGFSLRSKKLLDILSRLELDVYHPEDDIICRKLRPMLEKTYGIKFAPEEVANRFAIEAYGAHAFPTGNKYSGQFGFHGYHVQDLPIPPLPKVPEQLTRPGIRRPIMRNRR